MSYFLFKPSKNDSKGIYFKKHKPTWSRKIEEAKQQQCCGSWKTDEQVVKDLAKLRRMTPNLAEEKAQKLPNLNHKTLDYLVIGSARKL